MSLVNAGATFQRLMDMVMSGLIFPSCIDYLDDIIVISGTPEEYLRRIELML